MSEAPLMVGVSGLRGIVGKSLTPEVAARFAAAFGGWLKERAATQPGADVPVHGRPRVVIGRDGRAGGESISAAAVQGLLASGCDVSDLGVTMTPTVGVMVDALAAAGGMVVTASHNPQEWNGLKLLIRTPGDDVGIPSASAPGVEIAAEVIARFQRGSEKGPKSTAAGTATDHDMLDPAQGGWDDLILPIRLVANGIGEAGIEAIRRRNVSVILDCVNGAGRVLGPMLLRGLNCELVEENVDPTGLFPHPPEPLRENLTGLCAAVRRHRADIGFAQDPDADRLAIVDERGEYIGEEYTLVLAAEAFLGSSTGMKVPGRPRPVLVTNLSTSRMIDDVAVRHGAKVIRTAVGEANVVEAMKREKASGAFVALGGEGNGGVIWPAVTYVRDSLSAMALVLMLMARTGKPLSELVGAMPRYAIEKRKVDLARKQDAAPAVDKLAAHWKAHRVDLQDGVRVDFASGPLAGKAWIHVRASNTEPIMRLIAEAPEAAQARTILDEAAKVIG